MSLTQEQLIEKISEVSKLDKKLVAKELDSFVEQILQVSKGNPLTIEGLGVFRLKKGRLSLDTAPNLALEINYKYAGMMPLEIKKGNESSDNQLEQNSEVSTLQNDEELEESGSKSTKEDLGFEIGKVNQVEKKKEEEIKVPKKEKVETQIQVTDPILVDSALPKTEKKSAPKIDEAPKKVATPPTAVKSNQTPKIIAVVLAILVVVSVIVFLNKSNKEKTLAQKENVDIKAKSEVQLSFEPEKPKVEETKPDSATAKVKQTQPVKTSQPEPQIAQTKSISYGLSGEFNAEIPSYYGIVLYTLSFEARADAERSSWIKKGFRAYVDTWIITRENIKYRVALGQFATVEDAKQAALTLPAPFNEAQNHFIKRLNP